ncbi:MAG: archaemetzincin family Zn-dependent metalloprotease [Promethearchaeota archaeon]|jgi:archaemetzincin
MERILHLQKIGNLDESILNNLKSSLEQEFAEFNIEIQINTNQVYLTDREYNKSKQQFNASKILKKLEKEFPSKDYFRILGILDKDIYTKNFNFIFGIASMNTGKALISFTRLRESFYKENKLLYRKFESNKNTEVRILKEAIHELGHTFELKHCSNLCVMQFSDSLKEADKKPIKFCNSCLQLLKGVLSS